MKRILVAALSLAGFSASEAAEITTLATGWTVEKQVAADGSTTATLSKLSTDDRRILSFRLTRDRVFLTVKYGQPLTKISVISVSWAVGRGRMRQKRWQMTPDRQAAVYREDAAGILGAILESADKTFITRVSPRGGMITSTFVMTGLKEAIEFALKP
jgi:hypothetical protein